jgi:hypothetical protein
MRRPQVAIAVLAGVLLTSPCVWAVDTDGDGLPDDWEITYSLDHTSDEGVNGAQGDPDGDVVFNINEFRAGTSPLERDTDGNGINDYFEDPDGDWLSTGLEQDVYNTNPGDPDSDDDGLADGPEIQKYTDPNNPDSDGDGVRDGDEVFAGTNPADSNSVFRVVEADFSSTGPSLVQWSSETGKTYSVDRCASLSQGFVTVTSGVAATPPLNTYTDSSVGVSAFYVIRVEE